MYLQGPDEVISRPLVALNVLYDRLTAIYLDAYVILCIGTLFVIFWRVLFLILILILVWNSYKVADLLCCLIEHGRVLV